MFKKCVIKTCKNKSVSLDLCLKHYKRARKKGFNKIKDTSLWLDKIDYELYQTNESLIGGKWGKLKLLSITDKVVNRQKVGIFHCDCGNTIEKSIVTISRGKIRSCGCINTRIIDRKVGKLLPKKITCITKSGKRRFECMCDCGNIAEVSENYLHSPYPTCKKCKPKSKNAKCVGDIYASFWASKTRDARKRGIGFKLTIEEAWNLYLKQNKKCALSGRDIILAPRGEQGTASLDRIDSDGDYVIGNVQWVHKYVNLMKWKLNQDVFLEFCKDIVSNLSLSMSCS